MALPSSTHNTRLRRPAAAERHSSIAHRARRLIWSFRRCRDFVVGPVFRSQNRSRLAASPYYVLGLALSTILVFGRAHWLQTADMNSCPPLRLTRTRHSRIGSGSTWALYRSHRIIRSCRFIESTVCSKSIRLSVRVNLPAASIVFSLLRYLTCTMPNHTDENAFNLKCICGLYDYRLH